jgi:hypothetical protein
MTDDINRIFTETLAGGDEILGYECRDCGQTFNSGRDGRQHMFREHDDPTGLKKLKE